MRLFNIFKLRSVQPETLQPEPQAVSNTPGDSGARAEFETRRAEIEQGAEWVTDTADTPQELADSICKRWEEVVELKNNGEVWIGGKFSCSLWEKRGKKYIRFYPADEGCESVIAGPWG